MISRTTRQNRRRSFNFAYFTRQHDHALPPSLVQQRPQSCSWEMTAHSLSTVKRDRHYRQKLFHSSTATSKYPYPRWTKLPTVDDRELQQCIRSCMTIDGASELEKYSNDTGMSICFLGTSAGIPTHERMTSATILKLPRTSFLFDAGEGLQRQILFSRIKSLSIERIFITHLHGDHIFGLPGVLLSLNQESINKTKEARANNVEYIPQVVKVYGPPGLYNFIASNIALSCTVFRAIVVEVYELVGSRTRRVTRKNHRDPFVHHYPELNHRHIRRRQLEADDDGIWTIEDFQSQTREDLLKRSQKVKGYRGDLSHFRIQAAEVRHVPGVVTFGYSVEESEPQRNIDAERAMELGVTPVGGNFDLLKNGYSVKSNGGEEIHPEQVLKPKSKKARKVVIIGDNDCWSESMKSLAKDADVLVHEATLLETGEVRSAFSYEMYHISLSRDTQRRDA